MQARPSGFTLRHCVTMLGVLEGCGHLAKPLEEIFIFIPLLSGSAGT